MFHKKSLILLNIKKKKFNNLLFLIFMYLNFGKSSIIKEILFSFMKDKKILLK